MHEFERRMQQLLASHSALSRGHRERLMRPLKQSDLQCWGDIADTDLEQVLKVCFRTVAHELTDAFGLHAEAALAVCPSAAEKTLLAALLGYGMPLGLPVLLRIGSTEAGFHFRSTEMMIVEPLAGTLGELRGIQLEHHHSDADRANAAKVICRVRETGTVDGSHPQITFADSMDVSAIVFSESQVRENPFQCAAEAVSRLISLNPAG